MSSQALISSQSLIKLGVPARLVPPSSYRSTSAFEAIRANLAVPLRMALKMRSKPGWPDSKFRYSEIRPNPILEGTAIFGCPQSCPCHALAPTVPGRIIFFGRKKNSIAWRKALYKIPDGRYSRMWGRFFFFKKTSSRRYGENDRRTDGGKKLCGNGGCVSKKSQNRSRKKKKIKNFLERHLLCMRLFAVYFRGLRKGALKRAAMESPRLFFEKLDCNRE